MNISNLFNQLKSSLKFETTARIQDKALFIEQRVVNLKKQNLSNSEFVSKIHNYLSYSSQGIFNTLAFNKNIDPEIKIQIADYIQQYHTIHNLSSEEFYYTNTQNNHIKAIYNEKQQPKIALICSQNNMNDMKVLPFIDKEELNKIIKTMAVDDCFKQFRTQEMDGEVLISNIVKLSSSKDDAFKKIVDGLGYDISAIQVELTQEFDIMAQFDKHLKSNNMNKKLEFMMIDYLRSENMLDRYQHSRLQKHSILPDDAQERLMLSLENFNLKNDNVANPIVNKKNEEVINEITPPSPTSINFGELSKEHETLFIKVKVGNQHYWENSEKFVFIHPEKITVPKVTLESVSLAIDAAVKNFGNKLSINGTEAFKDNLLKVLAIEQYNGITLSNLDLQTKLDELRGIVPIENKITSTVDENIITQSPNPEMIIESGLNKKDEDTNATTSYIADTPELDSNVILLDDVQIMDEPSQCNELNILAQENDKITMLTAQNYDEVQHDKMAHENTYEYDSGR